MNTEREAQTADV